MTVQPEVCEQMVHRLLSAAIDAGAECLATLCPLCQVNLEAYQEKISSKFGRRFDLPIFYFTQVIGLALGLDEKQLLIGDNLMPGGSIAARY